MTSHGSLTKRNVLHITIAKFLAMVERYLRKNKRKKKKKKKEGKKEKIPVKIKRTGAIRMEQEMI